MSEDVTAVTLQKLGPKHKQAMSLLAQGVGRQVIAELCEWTPEYITWLARQPICQEYVREIAEFSDIRLAALADKVTDVISDTLTAGSEKGRLQAAKLQLEATHRIGPERAPAASAGNDDRLVRLSERLLHLLGDRQAQTLRGQATLVEDAQLVDTPK